MPSPRDGPPRFPAVINAKGEVLTNAHVVEGCQKITVKDASGNPETAVLVARDERNDLAVIRLAWPASSVAVFREGTPIRAGDAIVALGYPLSGVLATTANVSVGNVSALAGLGDDSRYLQISAPVQPGNSGGPLLDASGHLVGIVTAKLNAMRVAKFTGDIPQNVNFALKAEVARTFLDSKGIVYQTARSDQQLSPADVGDIARPFTVHVECEQIGAQTAAAPSITHPSEPENIEATRQQISWCTTRFDFSWPPSLMSTKANLIIEGCTAVIRSSRSPWAFFNRGLAYQIERNIDRAIADYSEAIRLDPTFARAFNNRGAAYAAKQDYDRAIADYNQAIRLDPEQIKTFISRGLMNLALRDYEHALRDFTTVARSPSASIEEAALGANRIGFMYVWGQGVAQDYRKALDWFRVAAEKGNGAAMNKLGELYAKGQGVTKDCNVAQEWLGKAAKAGVEVAKQHLRSGFDGQCQW